MDAFAPGAGLPFATTDTILAQCLRIAGVKEKDISPRNIYDEEILFKAGGGIRDADSGAIVRKSRFAGLSIIEAAKAAGGSACPQADDSGSRANRLGTIGSTLKGRVEYHFEHTPETGYLVNAYRDQERIVKDGEGDAAEAIREIMRLAAGRLKGDEVIMDEREALLRILCVALKTRIEYVNRWKQVVPTLHIKGKHTKTSETNGNHKTERHVLNDKFIPLNASDDLLRKMQLI